MKINILFLGNTTHPVGGYKVVYEYCNRLVESGHEITVYYLYGSMLENSGLPNIIRKLIVKVYGELIGPNRWYRLDRRIKKKVIPSAQKIGKGDIVIATAVQTAGMVKELPNICGRKVYFIQDFENWTVSSEEVLKTYNYDMRKIVVSNWLKNLVDKNSKERSYIVSNCIDTRVFYVTGKKRNLHSIVFHYRNGLYKGGIYAFKVIEMLHLKYPDLVVNMITTEKEIPEIPNYFNVFKNINQSKVAEINNVSQVFMCTTIDEGFGLPGLEAMACGCAVVSTSYKGVLEYAVDGSNALLSPVKDVERMTENIVKIFENDSVRKTIIDNGIKTGKERSLEKSARKFENILLNIIKE